MKRFKHHGMSLIELLIVMAIVAIIAAVAYPSYQDYMIRARRADATGDALELAQWMERFYTENGRYDQDRAGNAVALPFAQSPANGVNPHYTINFAAGQPTATTFTLSINRASAVQMNDNVCLDLSVDHAGRRCAVGGAHCSDGGTPADTQAIDTCW